MTNKINETFTEYEKKENEPAGYFNFDLRNCFLVYSY